MPLLPAPMRMFSAALVVWSMGLPMTVGHGANSEAIRVPVVFTEGHDTTPIDRGRPVILIAAALGVPAEVFREAFTHVRPSPLGERPDPEQVRENKRALMSALSKYGVTNQGLDEVSNYYRYVKSSGELWPVRTAIANAIVAEGEIVKFEVLDGGSGYTSPPTVSVSSIAGFVAKVGLSFGKDLESNGSISTLELASK